MEVTRSMVCRWSKMGKSDDRSIVVVGTVDEAKDGSGWGRTVGVGPHELRGDVLHVGKLPRDLGGHRRRVASRPLVAEASAVCDVKTCSVLPITTHVHISWNRLICLSVCLSVYGV